MLNWRVNWQDVGPRPATYSLRTWPLGDDERAKSLARYLTTVMQGMAIQARDGATADELQARKGLEASAEDFTNLSGVGNRTCFHKNVKRMWMLRQCMMNWSDVDASWTVQYLAAASEKLPRPRGLLDVDHPDFLLAERITEMINMHLRRDGSEALDERVENAPRLHISSSIA